MIFSSRTDAGRRLGELLAHRNARPDVVMGLPRGGVVVAAGVAQSLNRPLEVLVVRKIGHPEYREYAVGALAEPGVVVLDQVALAETRVDEDDMRDVITEETARVAEYQARFHPGGATPLAGKHVLIVDDGIATGATTEAAILSARKQEARKVALAVPVASTSAVNRLRPVADEIIALVVDSDFVAVGRYYDEFPQVTDAEVMHLLDEVHSHARAA